MSSVQVFDEPDPGCVLGGLSGAQQHLVRVQCYVHSVLCVCVAFSAMCVWFLGPPRRIPLAVCLGDPIVCIRTDNPTQEQINSCHEKLLEGYRKVFDTHKVAYGYADKELKFV